MPYFVRDTLRLYYEIHNPHGCTTRPLVLLHGLGSTGEDWLLQQTFFSGRFPVLTVDLRGHGRSSMGEGRVTIERLAGDIAALLGELAYGAAHVLGLSLGGAVALQLALDYPDRVCSLTIVNAFARLRIRGRGVLRTIGRLVLLFIGRMDWLGAWIAAGIFPNPGQEAWRDVAAARLAANPRENYRRFVRAIRAFDVVGRLHEVRAPALIIAGEQDTTIALEAKEILAGGIPDAKMARFPDSGHGTPYDAADRFNDVVMDFLLDANQR